MNQEIVITQFDHDRLFALLDRLRRDGTVSPSTASAIEDELERAVIVASTDVPGDVVTMNSEVDVFDLDSEQLMRIVVVFPGAAVPAKGKISVLAPLGLALLGARVGDEITWDVPGGVRRLEVRRILYQPEAAGRFDL